MFPDWQQFAFLATLVTVAALIRTGFGGSVAVLSVPMLALLLGPRKAAGFLLPLMCLTDLYAVWHYRKDCDWTQVRRLVPGSLLGILVGMLTFAVTSDILLRRILGIICLLFVAIALVKKVVLKAEGHFRPRPWQSLLFGSLSGYTSALAHAGGPIMTMYLLPQRMPPAAFAGTGICLFAVVNLIKVPPYLQQGLITPESLVQNIPLIPFMVAGTALGLWTNVRFSEQTFRGIVTALLFLSGLFLLLR